MEFLVTHFKDLASIAKLVPKEELMSTSSAEVNSSTNESTDER